MTRRVLFSLASMPILRGAGASVQLYAGTYGMQSVPVDEALRLIQKLGYDGAELCLMAGWASEPVRLDGSARRRIREQPLPIPSLLENLNLMVSPGDHARMLDRIRAAAALAHDISRGQTPLLQTVLGGRQGAWEQVRDTMAARLEDWARVAAQSDLKLAVKSHIGSASDTPEKLIWLLDKVNHPALSAIYDYSHFQLLGLELEASLKSLLARSAFVTVKDGRLVDGQPRFLLPGEGTIDYTQYFRLLRQAQYSGWMLVEISRQLQVLPGYDPKSALQTSYSNLAPKLRSAGLRDRK